MLTAQTVNFLMLPPLKFLGIDAWPELDCELKREWVRGGPFPLPKSISFSPSLILSTFCLSWLHLEVFSMLYGMSHWYHTTYFTGFPWELNDKINVHENTLEIVKHYSNSLYFLSGIKRFSFLRNIYNKRIRKYIVRSFRNSTIDVKNNWQRNRQAYLYKLSSKEVIFLLSQMKVNQGLLIQLLLLDMVYLAWIKCQLLNPVHLALNPSWKTVRWSPNLQFQNWLEIKSRNKFGIQCTQMEACKA